MEYILFKRLRKNTICGFVNIKATTECKSCNNIIYYKEHPICYVKSEDAHQYFASNYDGYGLQRGRLTQAIQKKLSTRDGYYQHRWDKIWDDALCQKYKRTDHEDFWLWNHDFFNASIDDLKYIAKLIGVKE